MQIKYNGANRIDLRLRKVESKSQPFLDKYKADY